MAPIPKFDTITVYHKWFYDRLTREQTHMAILIKEGMPCTYGIGSDSYAYEVVQVIDASTVKIRALQSTVVDPDGLGNGRRVYLPNPDATPKFVRRYFSRGKDCWGFATRGDGPRSWNVDKCGGVYFSFARDYRDPSF